MKNRKGRKYRLYIYSKHPANLLIIKTFLQEKDILDENTYKKYATFNKARVQQIIVYEIEDNREKNLLYNQIRINGMINQVSFFHGFDGENIITKISSKKEMSGIYKVKKNLKKIRKRR